MFWESNPCAYGAFQAREIPSGPRIGGISQTDKVRGYYYSKQVYEGEDFEDAKIAVENAHENFKKFFVDQNE